VEAVGPNVTRFKPGDRVFADLFLHGAGSFADYACARERAFLPIPVGMTFDEAATLPHSAVLAVQGLRLRDGRTPKAGDKVLIDGASGNVGPFAVQIAKAIGAEVTGVARTEKLDFVRALGTDHVIDYTTTDYTKAGGRYDWIVDTDSHHSVLAVQRALRPGGVYVTLGGTSWPILASLLLGPIVSRVVGKRLGLLIWWKPFNRPDMERVTELIAAGRVRPAIDRRFSLDQVVEALRWVSDGHARGKVLVIP
jgi:NADPH:quinone reductase-like Zn-dependent oxidoreductase